MNLVKLKMETEALTDWIERAESLGREFAARAAEFDQGCRFVADNYRQLKDERLFSLMIPEKFGGGGADYGTLSRVVRILGRHCGSTALSFAMHSHPVMVNVYKALRGDEQAVATVTKIAANGLVIAGTGANDWLQSNGVATPCEGGYRVSAHKRFVSGGPGADVFVSSAILPGDGENGAEQVIHYSIPFATQGITIQDNWKTLGMRGTGSNDVLMEDVFIPDSAVVLKRPAGEWHGMWDVILPIALPLIVSCYLGLADAAVEHAVRAARGKDFLAGEIGRLRNELKVAELALNEMVSQCDDLRFDPDIDRSDAILACKSIAATAVKNVVENAASIVGGPGFFQGHPVERIVRDIRALHYHPLPVKRQQFFSGRRALGLNPLG